MVLSISGNNYILVIYDYDSNTIHGQAIPDRKKESQVTVYEIILLVLKSRGLTPKLLRLDNETSTFLIDFMSEENFANQLLPPYTHRRDAAERAIRTFKYHFLSILYGTNPLFPINLWDKLLPQAIITLNLLRISGINPQLSAFSQIWGNFNFNSTPLVPAGAKLLIHENASVRESWAPHAVNGWYLGPALIHYRYYRVWTAETNSERIVDTVAWYPVHFKKLVSNSLDSAIATAQDLTRSLQEPKTNSPIPAISDSQRAILLDLSIIFRKSLLTEPRLEDTSISRDSNEEYLVKNANDSDVLSVNEDVGTPTTLDQRVTEFRAVPKGVE